MKVQKGDGCWVWTAGKNSDGYGEFYPTPRALVLAHRFSFALVNGPIASGVMVLHHCDNPPCVRPDHLFGGTHSDNMRDAYAKGRITLPSVELSASGRFTEKSHCSRGHAMVGENLYWEGRTKRRRRCRECAQLGGRLTTGRTSQRSV